MANKQPVPSRTVEIRENTKDNRDTEFRECTVGIRQNEDKEYPDEIEEERYEDL